ncbi:MAG: hypothetical protein IH571_00210 [Acholeplasmataceae bacterium]|nr:hypothetical protein [Acholeplasmataceae bacterium]
MRKLLSIMILLLVVVILVSCKDVEEEPTVDVFGLLMEAEDLSGMIDKTKTVVRADGSLGLPFSYKGVSITYSSRNEDIISNEGVVARPNECWIESRDQQGVAGEAYANLNDNWPIVVDVTLSYLGQSRHAKLLFVVAPQEGFSCDKYLG